MIQISDLDAQAFLRGLYQAEEVDKDVAQAIYKRHRKEGVDLVQGCLEAGVRKQAILFVAAQMRGLETVDLESMEVPQALLTRIKPEIANSYRIIPFRMDKNIIFVATADPENLQMLDDLKFMLGVDQVKVALTDEEALDAALEKYYKIQVQDAQVEQFIKDRTEPIESDAKMEVYDLGSFEGLDTSDVNAAADSAPVKKLLNLILLTAVKAHASDVHFEPFEEVFRVRNRIDGVLYDMLPVPKNLAGALTARVKVMATLDIAERRLPQDGKISVAIGGRSVDLRISTLPTMFGESVVIRVLDRSVVSLDLDRVGMEAAALERFRATIRKPNGVIVVTGPTGSGKTTTLYAALNEVNQESVKIITTEEPVEYEIDGLIQVPIEPELGKTFAVCLRSILRQNPDKIMVGECRDLETAKISVEAALTGHIVFTTLHTNDAATAVTRLLDMGVEPFLIAATLECILAQRLVRTICVHCKTPYNPSQEELMMLNIKPEQVIGQKFFYGRGCKECKNSGYRGRTAIFESIYCDPTFVDNILQKASASKMRAAAQRAGMVTLRDSGISKIFAGVTTIEEIVKETSALEE